MTWNSSFISSEQDLLPEKQLRRKWDSAVKSWRCMKGGQGKAVHKNMGLNVANRLCGMWQLRGGSEAAGKVYGREVCPGLLNPQHPLQAQNTQANTFWEGEKIDKENNLVCMCCPELLLGNRLLVTVRNRRWCLAGLWVCPSVATAVFFHLLRNFLSSYLLFPVSTAVRSFPPFLADPVFNSGY